MSNDDVITSTIISREHVHPSLAFPLATDLVPVPAGTRGECYWFEILSCPSELVDPATPVVKWCPVHREAYQVCARCADIACYACYASAAEASEALCKGEEEQA